MNRLKNRILNKPEVVVPVIVGVLACLLYGPITKKLVTTELGENMSKVRSINAGLLGYWANGDRVYPDNLQQLVDEDILEQRDIDLGGIQAFYIKGHDPNNHDDGDNIILYTSTYDIDDEYNACRGIVAYVDGSVDMVERQKLKTLLAQAIVRLRGKLSTKEIK